MALIHPACAEGAPRRSPPRPAQPQGRQQAQDNKQSQEDKQSQSEITEDLFGFTEGSTWVSRASWKPPLTARGASAAGAARYGVFSPTLELKYYPG